MTITSMFAFESSTHSIRFPDGARSYVIDDNSEMRKSLHALFATLGITTWPFAAAADFLHQLDSLQPAPILLDVRMPDIDGVDVMRELARREIDWPVIIITAHGDLKVAVQLMKLGAIEFLEKPFDLDSVEVALQRAFAQLSASDEASGETEAAQQKFNVLTYRESQVLSALLLGHPNKNVATDLSLSIRTVEMHRAHALAKLGVRNLIEAASLAVLARWPDKRQKATIV